MSQLVFAENNRPVTDSLTIAEVFGKTHDHVMRDIRTQIEKLNEAGESEWSITNFGETRYQHIQNKQWYPKFNLTEDAFAIVAMSYVTPEAMKMKIRFIGEFHRMREELNKPKFSLPQNYAEALRLAADLSEENERISSEKERLTLENKEQKQIISEQEAPVAIYKMAITAKNVQSVADVAKALGTGRNRMFDILRDEGIIIKGRTVPYQRFIDAGYFIVRELPRTSGDAVVNDVVTKVTAKGFDYIAKMMRRRLEKNG